MKIGIDIDDTLTSLLDVRIKTAQDYIKRNNLPYHLVRTDTNLFSEMFDWNQEECDKFWFLEENEMLANVLPRENASKCIKQLKDLGYEIYIITGRSLKWHKDPLLESYTWLIKNDIPFDYLYVEQEDKAKKCLELKIDFFVEDMIETLNRISSVGVKTIMMENSHNINRNDYIGLRAKNWNEVLEIIKNYKK
jgi:uncharacterized HAD superfamily protein